MLIWFLNMYIRYSNMYIMHYDCFQHFCVNAFITFNGNIDEFSPEDLNAVRGQMATMSNQVV